MEEAYDPEFVGTNGKGFSWALQSEATRRKTFHWSLFNDDDQISLTSLCSHLAIKKQPSIFSVEEESDSLSDGHDDDDDHNDGAHEKEDVDEYAGFAAQFRYGRLSHVCSCQNSTMLFWISFANVSPACHAWSMCRSTMSH